MWLAAVLAALIIPALTTSEQAEEAKSAGCGTIDGKETGMPCRQASLEGEVSAGQDFVRKIGTELYFRLNHEAAMDGWNIEVVPDPNEKGNRREYSWVATPPYHFWNPRYLDRSYGMSAKQALEQTPREFNFVLEETGYGKLGDLVDKAVMSHPVSDKRSEEEIEAEAEAAAESLMEFPVAKGKLTILDGRIGTAGEKKEETIQWLKFKVEFKIPCEFKMEPEGPGWKVDDSQCKAGRERQVK